MNIARHSLTTKWIQMLSKSDVDKKWLKRWDVKLNNATRLNTTWTVNFHQSQQRQWSQWRHPTHRPQSAAGVICFCVIGLYCHGVSDLYIKKREAEYACQQNNFIVVLGHKAFIILQLFPISYEEVSFVMVGSQKTQWYFDQKFPYFLLIFHGIQFSLQRNRSVVQCLFTFGMH